MEMFSKNKRFYVFSIVLKDIDERYVELSFKREYKNGAKKERIIKIKRSRVNENNIKKWNEEDDKKKIDEDVYKLHHFELYSKDVDWTKIKKEDFEDIKSLAYIHTVQFGLCIVCEEDDINSVIYSEKVQKLIHKYNIEVTYISSSL